MANEAEVSHSQKQRCLALMTGVYESGPADSVTDITDRWRDWWIEEGEGKERELEGEGLFDSCSSNFYFSRSAVQLRHTGFPCSMGLSIYIMIFIMYILFPNPKITPKPFSSWGQKEKVPTRINHFGYYYPFGDIMSHQNSTYLNPTHIKKQHIVSIKVLVILFGDAKVYY